MFITFTLWSTLIKYIRKTSTLTKNHKLTDSQTHDLYTLQTHDLYTLQTHDLYTLQTQDLYTLQTHDLYTLQTHDLYTLQYHQSISMCIFFLNHNRYLKGSEDNHQVLVDINKLHTLLVL